MTVTISLSPTIEAKLRSQAAVTGKDVTALVVEAIQQKFGDAVADVQSADDFDRTLDEFFAANPEPLPPLPADFSRADIYSDHD
jgi:hypothetical protein